MTDFGDCAPQLFADDEEHKRARNLPAIVASLNDLKPRAEVAIKSGGLVLVLGGDCTQIIGLLTGARRYYRQVSLLWFDRDADLNTPASTPSGRLDGMALATIIGKGSPELVRFWGEPQLVREPDTVIFGLDRIDPPEQEFLEHSPMRHVLRRRSSPWARRSGELRDCAAARGRAPIDAAPRYRRDRAGRISATNVPGSGGLHLPRRDARSLNLRSTRICWGSTSRNTTRTKMRMEAARRN